MPGVNIPKGPEDRQKSLALT